MIEEILKSARKGGTGRRWLTSEQKSLIVNEWEKSGDSGPDRRYGIITAMLYKWRKDAMRGATMGIKNEGDLYTKVELNALKKENDELKKALAEEMLDNRILKKKLEMDAKGQTYKAPRNMPGDSK